MAAALVWCGWEDVRLFPEDRCSEALALVTPASFVLIVCWPSRLPRGEQRALRSALASMLSAPLALAIVLDDLRGTFWGSLDPEAFCPSGGWHPAVADECCYFAAHRRPLRFAANADIVRSLRAECAHVHDGPVNPPEAFDLTAALAVSLAAVVAQWASHCLNVQSFLPRLPRPERSGSRVGWGAVPRAAVTTLAFASVATRLGLIPPACSPGTWYPAWLLRRSLPFRRSPAAEDVCPAPEPAEPVVYISSGSSLHRQRTVFASHICPGRDCTYAEATLRYSQWLLSPSGSAVRSRLPELQGKALVCECPLTVPCHGDVLSLMAARGSEVSDEAVCALLPAYPSGLGPPPRLSVRFPQEGVEAALRGLFPFSLKQAPIPILEDLLVQLVHVVLDDLVINDLILAQVRLIMSFKYHTKTLVYNFAADALIRKIGCFGRRLGLIIVVLL